MSKCLICSGKTEIFLSFGKMPLGNGFLTKKYFKKEYFYSLKVAFCKNCKMVQLVNLVDREKMFNKNYAFYSSTSKLMAKHFEEFAKFVIKGHLKSKSPFVLEIGSNDGILLKHFAKRKIKHLGVEPSANVADVAKKNGVNTICKFFDEETARDIASKYGKVSVILGANVICHIPYLNSLVAGVKVLLKERGVFIFEEPYLGDIVLKTSYDQIYDEHAFLFCVTSLKYVFEKHGLEIIDVSHQDVHGGSMRYTVAKAGAFKKRASVDVQLKFEKKLGLGRLITFKRFAKSVKKSSGKLKRLLVDTNRRGRVAGYAATSKSTTILNYAKIDDRLLEYICDTTPIKIGKFSPGMHVPIKSYYEFAKNYPDFAVLFGWNHAKEIMAKEKDFVRRGGKWIVFVPEVKIL